ncbi:MAG: hypothetical protein GC131_06690 [Alphaproteobacteria bacterium]|nr:hypothetical protein [Alphaproteobacteria bacterium]
MKMRAPRGFLAGLLAAWLGFGVFASLAMLVPEAAVEKTLQANWSPPSAEQLHMLPGDYFTECAMMSAAMTTGRSLLHRVLNPLLMVPPDHYCRNLAKMVHKEAAQVPKLNARYWQGPAFLLRALLPAIGPGGMRLCYLWLTITGIGFFLLAARRHPALVVVAGTLFAGCFAFAHWGGMQTNLAHAPVFIIAPWLLGVCLLREKRAADAARREYVWLAGAGALGALTAFFDMLFGGIPFNLMLLMLTLSLRHDARFSDAFAGALAFAAGLGATILLKLVAVAALMGDTVFINNFFDHLLYRMQGVDTGEEKALYATPVEALLTYQPGFAALPWMGAWLYGAIMAAGGAAAIGLPVIFGSRPTPSPIWRLYGSGMLAVLVFPAWYMVFANHTLHHPHFMLRFALLAPLAALALAALLLFGVKSIPSGREAAMLDKGPLAAGPGKTRRGP